MNAPVAEAVPDKSNSASGVGPPVIGICIVNYFSSAAVGVLMRSLQMHAGEAELIISCLDNSQSQPEFEALRRIGNSVNPTSVTFVLHRSPVNCGYAAGNNLAAATFGRDVHMVVVVNPDVTLLAGTLESLAELIGSTPGAIFAARTWSGLNFYGGLSRLNRWTSVSREARQPDLVGAVGWRDIVYPGGHFLAMSLDTWRLLGGLSEDFFLFAEEADFTVRAIRAGLSVLTTERVEVEHRTGLTSGATAKITGKSLTCLREATRSAVIFSRKHTVLGLPSVLICRLALAASLLLRSGPRPAAEVLHGIRLGLYARVTSGVGRRRRPCSSR